MTRIARIIVGLLVAILLLPACQPQVAKKAPDEITMQLKWTHNAQFAGFYAAEQNGYYQAEGLAVTLAPGGPGFDYLKAVLDGNAQFGVAGAVELIQAREQGLPLRAIATLYRRNPSVFFALADSGIARPQDFVGKKIRVVTELPLILHAMMSRLGVRPDQYSEVSSLPSDVALFAAGDPPVWGAYITAMTIEAQRAGYKLNIIYPDDYGVHLYGDALFTTDALIAAKPELVQRFLRATLKGWTWAVENVGQVGPLVAKYNPDADAALETAKMTASLPFVNTGEDHIGWMKPEMWAEMAKTLREQGVLTKDIDVSQVYTLRFVQEVYKK